MSQNIDRKEWIVPTSYYRHGSDRDFRRDALTRLANCFLKSGGGIDLSCLTNEERSSAYEKISDLSVMLLGEEPEFLELT